MTPVAAARAGRLREIVVDPRSRGEEGINERAYSLVVAVAALTTLVVRRPDAILRPEFWAEDGPFYTAALTQGWRSIGEPNAGYLVIGQRLLTLPQLLVPPLWAPLVANVLAIAIAAGVAMFLASTRMSPLFPERWQRIGLAAAFLLLPIDGDLMIGTLANIQWVVGVWLLALTAATRGPRLELVLVGIACLTGPVGPLLLPLFIARWWHEQGTWPVVLTVAGAAAIQFIVLLLVPQRGSAPADLTLLPMVILERTVHLSGLLALGLLVVLLVATRFLDWRLRLAAVYAIAFLPLATMLHTLIPTAAFFTPGAASRYFWIGSGVVLAMLLAKQTRTTLTVATQGIALIVLAVAFAPWWRIQNVAVAGWADKSSCIGEPAPCSVPVSPGERFTVVWPGR